MENFLICLGYIAVIFHLFAFASKSESNMLKLNLSSTTLLGLSMIPYGGLSGAAMSFFSAGSKIAGLSGYFGEITNKKKAVIGLMFGLVFFIFFNKEGYFGLLPAASLIFILLADLQTDVLKMKLWYYGSASCWIIYAISIQSPAAILYDVLGIGVLTYTVLKIQKERKF